MASGMPSVAISFVEMIRNIRDSSWPVDLELARIWYQPQPWFPKLGEELGEADIVLLLLGDILPICKMAMSFPLLPRSGIYRQARIARQ
jgi:hypothetical protein